MSIIVPNCVCVCERERERERERKIEHKCLKGDGEIDRDREKCYKSLFLLNSQNNKILHPELGR